MLMGTEFLSRQSGGRDVALTTHHHLTPRLTMGRALYLILLSIPPEASYEATFTFHCTFACYLKFNVWLKVTYASRDDHCNNIGNDMNIRKMQTMAKRVKV
jgi:hypothetical protein